MKKLIYIISFLFSIYSFADTTFVTVHNNVDMTWHGSYNEWGEFPDGQENYRKICTFWELQRCSQYN